MQAQASVGAPAQLPEFGVPLWAEVTSSGEPCCHEVETKRCCQILPGMVGYISITAQEVQIDNGVENDVRFLVDDNLNFRISSDHCPRPRDPVIKIGVVAYHRLRFYFVNTDCLKI
jgi:hypothetical protein